MVAGFVWCPVSAGGWLRHAGWPRIVFNTGTVADFGTVAGFRQCSALGWWPASARLLDKWADNGPLNSLENPIKSS